jgi:hypothetical protein
MAQSEAFSRALIEALVASEQRTKERGMNERTENLFGCYTSPKDGTKFRYYGKYVSGRGAYWEARVFRFRQAV